MGLRSTYRRCRFRKKIIFSDEAHFAGYVNKQNCRIWGTENPHTYIEKPTHLKRVTVWWGFWSRGITWLFVCENKQGEVVTVNGDRYWPMLNEFLITKIEEELHSTFCALFLKVALSSAELISFRHLGAAIWHRCAIICGVPSKVSVTPTSQRQLTL